MGHGNGVKDNTIVAQSNIFNTLLNCIVANSNKEFYRMRLFISILFQQLLFLN